MDKGSDPPQIWIGVVDGPDAGDLNRGLHLSAADSTTLA
jgi:hypothetical protein